MTQMEIVPLGDREFRVRLRESGQETVHRVTVPGGLGDGSEAPHDLERVVRESFRFLLEREPPSAILARFSLSDISRYFPEYPDELERRLP
ncbi:hypothetical protein PJ985_13350 [Streptomyces sp. ACA25]|uniref:hypothetical protein n=1 Tax=Streptomyces sp. ACA25 TaxID=3022596 RepID=UPI002306FB69|nr:hypothetical protein [Streptomyces sp. ACA25]MDB1088554.1 hypothetical protein [Streptomyces sp. ACA25]